MKTFAQYLAEMTISEQYDVFQNLTNILANCRSNPFMWLGELKDIYDTSEKQGVPEITRMIYELIQLSAQFQRDVSKYVQHGPSGKVSGIDSRYDNEYQPRYERFMRQAHDLIDRVRQRQGKPSGI